MKKYGDGCAFFFNNDSAIVDSENDKLIYNQSKSEEKIITIAEYAKLHNINVNTLRKHCEKGKYKTAHKIGNKFWYINKYETCKTGRRVNNYE